MKRPEGPGPAPVRAPHGRSKAVRATAAKKGRSTVSESAGRPVVPITSKKPADPVAEAIRVERRAAGDAQRAEAERRRFERREARRFTRKSRNRRMVWVVLGGAVSFLLALLLAGIFSPLFAVRTITVIGAQQVSGDQVEAALTDQLGVPLPLVDASTVTAQLGGFPLIESFSIERQLPGTLIVRLVERTPIGTVSKGSGWDVIDSAGVILARTEERNPDYPIFTMSETTVDGPGFSAAVQVLHSLPAEMRASVDTISAGTKDDVRLVLRSGQQVLWGSAEDSDLKAVGLQRLMAAQGSVTGVLYDVSSPLSLVVRTL